MGDDVKGSPIGKASDLKRGQMREVEVGGTKVLLVRTNDNELHACGFKCSHYGAPLATGVLNGDRVRCPWHGACFNVKTGDIEELAGLDALPTYPVKVKDDQIFIEVEKDVPLQRLSKMISYSSEEKKQYVIVGGGAAGIGAIQGLREGGFAGRIIVLSADTVGPVDRPRLSKAPDGTLKGPYLLRSDDFFKSNGVELRLSVTVTGIDTEKKTLLLGENKTQTYDEVLIATGGSARRLDIPGSELEQVVTLRNHSDALKVAQIVQSGKAKNVCIVGSSFIGLEIGTWLSKQPDIKVHIIGRSEYPLTHVFGESIGKWIQTLTEAKGVKFYSKVNPTQIEGKESVTGVVLDNGEKIPADLVIAGIGVILNTNFLKNDSKYLSLEKDNSILVNQYLRHEKSGIYAAGDIATYPYGLTGENIRVEHWDVALAQGRCAGLNMAGKQTGYTTIPYFWSGLHANIRFCGYVRDPDEILLDGKADDGKWVAYFIKNNVVHAVASTGRDPAVSAAAELLRIGKMPTATSIKEKMPDLPQLLASLQAEDIGRKSKI